MEAGEGARDTMPARSQPPSESESQVAKVTLAGCETKMILGEGGRSSLHLPAVFLAQHQDGKLLDLTWCGLPGLQGVAGC